MRLPLSRTALRRVLHSLILSSTPSGEPGAAALGPTIDENSLFEEQPGALGFDSLDLLQISAAVNEMFHLHEAGLDAELARTPLFSGWPSLIEEAWQRGVEHLTVTTSGTSGRRKPCTHTFHALNVEVELLAGLFGDRKRVVALTPAHHIYGLLFSAMLPDRLGIPARSLLEAPVAVDAGEESTPVLTAGDLLVSFPEGWNWVLKSRDTFPADVVGVVSTAPCPQALKQMLMDANLSRLAEVYGSSETAGVGVRVWPAESYTLMRHWMRTGQASDGGVRLLHRAGFSVDVMDALRFVDDTTFQVEGRKDHAVQVGGVNVSPHRIAERLKEHPGVAEASVRMMRPEEGQRLKCLVVPADGCSAQQLRPVLDRWIGTWPVAAERPKQMSFAVALPRNALGKLQDW